MKKREPLADRILGKIGTPRRDNVEKQLAKELAEFEIKIPKIWFDSNAWFGYVESVGDIRVAFFHNTSEYCAAETFTEFLHLCRQHSDNETLSFGLRMEHSGAKTLLQFLVENGVEITD